MQSPTMPSPKVQLSTRDPCVRAATAAIPSSTVQSPTRAPRAAADAMQSPTVQSPTPAPGAATAAMQSLTVQSPTRAPRAAAAAASPSPTRRGTAPAPSPGVQVTLADGSKINIPKAAIDAATCGTRAPTPDCPLHTLLIFDGGWGGVDMVVCLAKLGYAAIVHIKGATALFPHAELEEKLRGMPGGSSLEMKCEFQGITLMAVAYNYNSKKTLFFVAPEGAGTTLEGVPYTTKWPDDHRNVQSRDVPRPCICSRYFLKFNKVDKHNQMRQHELNVEGKWGTADAFFRIFCTLLGITVVDTMLAVKATSHPAHAVRNKTTKEFTESLCEEMLANTIDGAMYDRSYGLKRKSLPVNGAAVESAVETPGDMHVLLSFGSKSDYHQGVMKGAKAKKGTQADYLIQRTCVVCGAKASTYCSRPACTTHRGGRRISPAVCSNGKRGCIVEHIRLADKAEAAEKHSPPFPATPASVKKSRH